MNGIVNNSRVFLCLQPQCQAVQDVEKAVSLFESTGKISATVMEARYTVTTSET